MKSINSTSFESKLIYRVNGALALLFCLLIFTGTLLEIYNISAVKFFSEGNVIILMLVLFVSFIFLSWYNEKLSGILLLALGTFSFIYFIFHIENWLIYSIAFISILSFGIFFLLDSYKRKTHTK